VTSLQFSIIAPRRLSNVVILDCFRFLGCLLANPTVLNARSTKSVSRGLRVERQVIFSLLLWYKGTLLMLTPDASTLTSSILELDDDFSSRKTETRETDPTSSFNFYRFCSANERSIK
jgi:hypothetical protein